MNTLNKIALGIALFSTMAAASTAAASGRQRKATSAWFSMSFRALSSFRRASGRVSSCKSLR